MKKVGEIMEMKELTDLVRRMSENGEMDLLALFVL